MLFKNLDKQYIAIDIAIPKQNIKIKDKTLKRHWKSKGLQRCTKIKQNLY